MDLLFKNPSYFFSTYFNVPWWKVLICFLCVYGVVLFSVRLFDERKAGILWMAAFSASVTVILITSLMNESRAGIQSVLANPLPSIAAAMNGDVHKIRAICSNILLYIPLGFFLAARRWSVWKNCLFGCVFSILMEGLQYFLCRGCSELLDVICNTLGAAAGAALLLAVMSLSLRKR